MNEDTRVEEFREAFNECDSNQDGTIQFDEFVVLLHNLGAGMSDHDYRIGFREIDVNSDGCIDFEEFMSWWVDH